MWLSKPHSWTNLQFSYFYGGEIKPVTKNPGKIKMFFEKIAPIPSVALNSLHLLKFLLKIFTIDMDNVCVIRLSTSLHIEGQTLNWKNETQNSSGQKPFWPEGKFWSRRLTQLTSAANCQSLVLALTKLRVISAPAKIFWNPSRRLVFQEKPDQSLNLRTTKKRKVAAV